MSEHDVRLSLGEVDWARAMQILRRVAATGDMTPHEYDIIRYALNAGDEAARAALAAREGQDV